MPVRAANEAILTTRPQPCCAIAGAKACVHRNVPVTFTANSRFHSSNVWWWSDEAAKKLAAEK